MRTTGKHETLTRGEGRRVEIHCTRTEDPNGSALHCLNPYEWRTTRMAMSYLLYDALLPHLGADAAAYWATTFVVSPV